MSKYKCLCGEKFKREPDATRHQEHYKNSVTCFHYIFERSRFQRFGDWFWNYNWPRLFRFVGAYMVYVVFLKHFKINFDMLESLLIGIGMGLYIE